MISFPAWTLQNFTDRFATSRGMKTFQEWQLLGRILFKIFLSWESTSAYAFLSHALPTNHMEELEHPCYFRLVGLYNFYLDQWINLWHFVLVFFGIMSSSGICFDQFVTFCCGLFWNNEFIRDLLSYRVHLTVTRRCTKCLVLYCYYFCISRVIIIINIIPPRSPLATLFTSWSCVNSPTDVAISFVSSTSSHFKHFMSVFWDNLVSSSLWYDAQGMLDRSFSYQANARC